MIHWSFLLVEASAFILAGLVGWEAWKAGTHKIATLAVAIFFGLLIEFFFVSQYAGYEYGHFLISPPILGHHVPLWVGVGWGTIIYTAMQATDRMHLPWGVRAPLDGLLAVSLDVTLDPIAEALGWWHWHRPGQYFGVPYDNFIGWVMIVGFYSFFVRAGFALFAPGKLWRDVLIPVAALIPAVFAVAGCQIGLDTVLYPMMGEALTFFTLVCLCVGVPILFVKGKVKSKGPIPWYLTAIPAYYHGLMVFCLLATDVHKTFPELLVLFPLALVTSLVAFRLGVDDANSEAQKA